MVGSCAMGPEPVVVNGNAETDEEREAGREKILKRFEGIGLQIMRRAGSGGPFEADPIAGVLSDRDKRADARRSCSARRTWRHTSSIEATAMGSSVSPRC